MSRFHMIPRQGKPSTPFEHLSQILIKFLAWLPVYTAIVATLTLYVIIFGVPFVKGY